MVTFYPQLSKAEATRLARTYVDEKEEAALAAGREIYSGRPSRAHLNTIFEWKTKGRGRSRLLENSDVEICEALKMACNAKQPRSGIAVLMGLYGVNTPVASAIATVIHPTRYTIIDFRALRALGHDTVETTIPFYLEYLDYCLSLASRWDLPLRNHDRALWQWSSDQDAEAKRRNLNNAC